MTEDYTPSIHIEPPSDSNEQALFASLEMFDSSYCPTSEADHCYPQPPTLFIQSSEPLHVSTELSPLDEFLAPNLGFSPCTSGRSSPVGAWSPVSSFSGDVFPEDLSQEELSWNAHSAHSSPAHSPSSLSPLTVAFDNVALEENYPGVDHTILSGPPAFSRLRSSSQSMPSAAPSEMWAEGVGRGRSSSFSGSTNTHTQFYPNPFPENEAAVQVQVPSVDVTFSDPLGTSMSWGSEATAEDSSNVNVNVGDHLALGTLSMGWKYPNRESSSTDSEDRAPPSPSLLTVPNLSLRRRPACSSRRTLSHSDLNSLMPPDADVGRGRGQHRTTLSIPSSRSVSSGSRASSRDVSPHSLFDGFSPSSLYSPSSAGPSSPAFEDADADDEREGGAVSVGRRRTFTAIRETDEYLPSVSALNRAASAPTRARRSRSSTSALPSNVGLGVFKAERTDAASFLSASPGDGDISRQEFRFTQPPAHPAFKAEVASNKIRQASNARRLNVAAFECPLPTCSSTFTARHNLINHINSHNKYRPHKCLCGMSFTTQGVLNRHKKRCRK